MKGYALLLATSILVVVVLTIWVIAGISVVVNGL